MQTLDIISINLWQIVISLLNLLLLFLIVKFFLYGPVKKMLSQRQATIEKDYQDANDAKSKAMADKTQYETKLSHAQEEADGLIQTAVESARQRESEMLIDAKSKADGIVRQAQTDAKLETQKAEQAIKEEIVKVGTLLASKILKREISADDHKQMIDAFLEEIGDENETNK